ncbi:MAG TPA: type II toxin-antitoxin system Phd/YefM family antitoxin [Candidatus Limiplasma sp.]|nr:type II toxin-antitoxin system Phd/YefM family antitoxin [Candidatus Limiplasma sp.]
MRTSLSLKSVMNNIVSITRFNRGEASKIFNEVAVSGTKVVLKNNTPACVLVSPQEFAEWMEQLENYALLQEASQRIAKSKGKQYTEKDVMTLLGISEDELAKTEESPE